MSVKSHGPKVDRDLQAVLDQTACRSVRYLEFAPPEDLALWVEAIAIVSVSRPIPRRRWRLLGDQRARASLPLGTGGAPSLRRPVDERDVKNAFPPGNRAVVRFTPWANGSLGFTAATEPWWHRASTDWTADRFADLPSGYRSVCRWLRRALPPGRPDFRAARCWIMLQGTPGRFDIETFARSIGVAPRTLRRLMQRACGCTSSRAREIERLRTALRSLRMDLELPWVRAAIESDYCDQSHFNRAFRKLSGMAPSRFFREGHHHANDIFALQVEDTLAGLPLRAVGLPRLRSPGDSSARIVRHRRT